MKHTYTPPPYRESYGKKTQRDIELMRSMYAQRRTSACSTMKKPKKYPMNGPSIMIQKLMESPQRNREELQKWAKENPNMRPETLQHIPK